MPAFLCRLAQDRKGKSHSVIDTLRHAQGLPRARGCCTPGRQQLSDVKLEAAELGTELAALKLELKKARA